MAKYLNLDGLQTLWAKLKDTFALKKHSHTVEDIPVDSALSSTSENPVQNKVVNTALNGKANTSGTYKGLIVGVACSSYAGDSNLSDLMSNYDNRGWTLDTPTGEERQIKKTLARDERISVAYQSWKPCRIRIRYSIKTNLQRDDGEGKEGWMGTDMAIYHLRNGASPTGITYSGKRVYGSENPEWADVDVTLNIDSKTYDTFYFFFQTQDSSGTTGTKRKGFVWIKGLRIERLPDTAVSAINDKNGKDITSRYVPITRAGIYGCRVKRAKNGGNWYDNDGFQIAESYASSFRTHWVTFRWSSAAQMTGSTERGCRRFLFGYEETGRFLRCFVSEDDTYWYVWILFMNAKTGGAIGSNSCSVMEMQSVPNGLEVLTTAPDMTNLTEIPWAADERYAPKSHTHAGTDVTSAVNYSKMQEAELLDNTKDIVTEIKKINTRCVKWYRWNETSRPTNAPTNSARSMMQAIVQYENGVRITLVAYPQDTSQYYYIAHYAGTSATTISWRIVYTVPTSTYSATGTQAVNGTAVASAISTKADAASVTGATKCKVTYNNQGVVTAGADLAASDIPNLAASKITSGTFADERIASASKWNAKQDDISDLIPTAASASNPLCDKAYADAIGERLEARYLGCNANGDPFATHAALTSATKFYYQGAETTPDTNDITTVVADEDHKNTSNVAGTTRYRYGGVDASGKPVWAFEYVINNTGLSQAQLLAVNSGITATKVGNYDSHLSDTTKHITAAERTAWNGKQNALTQGTNITISGNTISATNTTYSEPTDTILQDIVDALT